ncbi:hypothetical protein [Cognatiluteimonas profundi]|uniref:hypothetical protein n=1 Tax=Cognatiluteimonas profundi TaxID=2594501 RepID=UPI00131BC4AC|nr:hypothetical protein [Lysobacter profundi]
MIVTDRFVFLHLHKSGGSFVNRFLVECMPGCQQVGYHLPRDSIPAAARQLPILGTARNPWDYYVSWYSFQHAMPQPNALFQLASDARRLDFAGTLRNLMRLGDDPRWLAAWMERLPSQLPNRGINLSKDSVAPLAGSGLGFYSFLYRRMYGDVSNTTLIDMARLREGLRDFLPSVGIDLTPTMQEWLRDRAPINTSAHAHYSAYYDAPTRELVAAKDAELIQRHGFRFDEAASIATD